MGQSIHEQVCIEPWVSLASLLRSYTAAHGLDGNRQATVELGENNITVRHGNGRLELNRQGAMITWRREAGRNGLLELTEAGRLRSINAVGDAGEGTIPGLKTGDLGHPDESPVEEEMDMVAEAWARELMHES